MLTAVEVELAETYPHASSHALVDAEGVVATRGVHRIVRIGYGVVLCGIRYVEAIYACLGDITTPCCGCHMLLVGRGVCHARCAIRKGVMPCGVGGV